MNTLINGIFQDCLPVNDRGLNYGDGLFETIACHAGELPFWSYHYARLTSSCERLKILVPDEQLILSEIGQLVTDRNRVVVKLILTRGAGSRGYAIQDDIEPTRIITISKWPELPVKRWSSGVRLRVCDTRLANQPFLAGIKHLNRLEQVWARSEWNNPDIHEGILCDRTNYVIEATAHNIFGVIDGEIYTPELTSCGVAGVMRQYILEMAETALNLQTHVRPILLDELLDMDEIFLCNSIHGIWPVCEIGTRNYQIGKLTCILRDKVAQYLPYE